MAENDLEKSTGVGWAHFLSVLMSSPGLRVTGTHICAVAGKDPEGPGAKGRGRHCDGGEDWEGYSRGVDGGQFNFGGLLMRNHRLKQGIKVKTSCRRGENEGKIELRQDRFTLEDADEIRCAEGGCRGVWVWPSF